MLKDFMFSQKDGFFIWFDKKLKKEYYITQIEMCKTTFVRKRNDKFKSIKLIDAYIKLVNGKPNRYFYADELKNFFSDIRDSEFVIDKYQHHQ